MCVKFVINIYCSVLTDCNSIITFDCYYKNQSKIMKGRLFLNVVFLILILKELIPFILVLYLIYNQLYNQFLKQDIVIPISFNEL